MKFGYKPILVFSIFLPAISSIFVVHTLQIIDAPFYLLLGFVFVYCAYRVLQKFSLSKERSALVVLLCSIFSSVYLVYCLHYEHTAEGIFRRLVNDELPQGVEFVHKEGMVPLAGGSESIVFSLSADNFSEMIGKSAFKECSLDDLYKRHRFLERMLINNYGLKPTFAYQVLTWPDKPYMSGVILVTNKEKNLVYLYRWKV